MWPRLLLQLYTGHRTLGWIFCSAAALGSALRVAVFTLDLHVQLCLSSPDLRMETDVLLMQASLEGEVAVEGQETTAQDGTSFTVFPNIGETMSAWIPRSYPPKDHVPRLGFSDCSYKKEPLQDPPIIPET